MGGGLEISIPQKKEGKKRKKKKLFYGAELGISA